jgi:hypothetical protein
MNEYVSLLIALEETGGFPPSSNYEDACGPKSHHPYDLLLNHTGNVATDIAFKVDLKGEELLPFAKERNMAHSTAYSIAWRSFELTAEAQ